MTRFFPCLRFVVALLLIVCCPRHGLAADDATAAPVHLRVGVYGHYPIIFEKAGKPTGFQLELLKEIANTEGWTLEYRFSGSMKNVLDGLAAGEIDLAMGVVPSAKGRERFDFTKERNAVITGQIFVAAERDDIQSMNDLDGKTVAYVTQCELGAELIRTSEMLRVSPQFKEINTYSQIDQAVATGAVDAGLFTTLQSQRLSSFYNLKPTPIVLPPAEVQYAVRKGSHQTIITTIDSYLRNWKTTDKSVYHSLESKFLQEKTPLTTGWDWGNRQILIALGVCLLLIIFGIMIGNFLHDASTAPENSITKGHTKHIVIFVAVISLSFWLLDACIAWAIFNPDKRLTLLEWTITKVPAENLYIRAMMGVVCCVFGIFVAKYMTKYDEIINLLVTSISRFEQLTDNARDMIFRMSLPKGEYEFVSKASSSIFGYSPEEFYQKPLLIRDMVHRDWRWYFSKQWDELLAGKTAPYYEYQVVDKTGKVRWINQRTTLYFNDKGAPYAVEGIITDVTELRQGKAEAEPEPTPPPPPLS